MCAASKAWFRVLAAALLGACSSTEAPPEAAPPLEPPPHCTNQRHDSNEGGVDCGGTECRRCINGEGCVRSSDCENRQCYQGLCRDPVCSNSRLDAPETDIDCGGTRCPGCAPGQRCVAATDCESGVCADELCAEPACDDQVRNGGEVDVDCGASGCPGCEAGIACTDPAQCRSASCDDGRCTALCDEGRAECDDDLSLECETNTQEDPAHCGACQAACALEHAEPSCRDGVCLIARCEEWYADCNGDPADGCEIHLGRDPEHCGDCEVACSSVNASPGCTNGVCALTCALGYDDCDRDASTGCETSLTDPVHCGGCGRVCVAPAGETAVCLDGECAAKP